MPEGLFDQPFVYCGVCHKHSTKEEPLYLTSCAHTLCLQHLNNTICPICGTRDILVIKLVETKQLPEDIRILFQPIPAVLENLYNVSQFQITGLVNQCQYYQENCIKLREKCARQRQLLYQAKEELDAVAKLKSRIAELEASLARRSGHMNSSGSSVFTAMKPPDTVDLTGDDHVLQRDEQSFIQKLKTSSSLRNKLQQPLKRQTSASVFDRSFNDNEAIAESTQLDRFISTPSTLSGKKYCSSPIVDPLTKASTAVRTDTRGSEDSKKGQSQFPSALDKLRIVKRNHTFNNTAGSFSRGSQGLTPHMRSSNNMQTQTGLLMRRNTSGQPNSNSEGLATAGTSKKFRRIR